MKELKLGMKGGVVLGAGLSYGAGFRVGSSSGDGPGFGTVS